MSKLFSDDEGSGGHEVQLTINEHYSKAFEYRKEREELERRMFFVTK
jgi:protein KRI1